MATIVNTPGTTQDNSWSSLVGVILVLAFMGVLLYILAPMLRNAFRGPSISVPEQVDVNVNMPNQGGQPSQPSQ